MSLSLYLPTERRETYAVKEEVNRSKSLVKVLLNAK